MATTQDLAVLAASAYHFHRTIDNDVGAPEGWTRLPFAAMGQLGEPNGSFYNSASGFEGFAYSKGNEIVVSFAGTYFGDGIKEAALGGGTPEEQEVRAMSRLDWENNIGLGLGVATQQLLDAARFYATVKQRNPTAKITVTGHSLGGGLAALIGVFFDVDAVTFDAAFFRAAAKVANAQVLAKYLASFGLSDPALASYQTTGEQVVSLAATAVGSVFGSLTALAGSELTVPLTIATEHRVTSIAIKGEVLESARDTMHLGISSTATQQIAHGWTNLSSSTLHSMVLLTAFELHQPFLDLSRQLPDAGALIFSDELYNSRPDRTKVSFLDHLIQEQVGVSGPGNHMLEHFSNDLQKIVPGTLALSKAGMDALTVAAIEWYYAQQDAYDGTEFFNVNGSALQFDHPSADMLRLGLHSKLSPYLQTWVDELFAPLGLSASNNLRFAQWSIALGANEAALDARDQSQTQAMIGGAASDQLRGGSLADMLLGGAGSDILDGGAGNDLLVGGDDDDILTGGDGADNLVGGAGIDTYHLGRGDRVIDADGLGVLMEDGEQLTGGKQAAPGVWIGETGKGIKYVYTLVSYSPGSTDLLIRNTANGSSVTIAGWSMAHNLGVNLSNVPYGSSLENGQLLQGDGHKMTNSSGSEYVLADGNYVFSEPEPGALDLLRGGALNDTISGAGGHDALSGMDGDDVMDGDDGNDVLMGGLGRDVLNGGNGDDFLYGSGVGGMLQPTRTDFEKPAGSGIEVIRGFSWVISKSPAGELIVEGLVPNTLADDDGNLIDGGAGNDNISAGSGDDVAHGGVGNDSVTGLAGDDVLFGDEGDDFLSGDGLLLPGVINATPIELHGADTLDGGSGNDTLQGQGGDDYLYGGAENDLLIGDTDGTDPNADFADSLHGGDYLDGGDGDDILEGDGSSDELHGGDGNDQLFGDGRITHIDAASSGDDYLDGGAGNDVLEGGAGKDRLVGGSGDDVLHGDGDDIDPADQGNDDLNGGAGADQLKGYGGDDSLRGGSGDDTMAGDDGNDYLFGDDGNDLMAGGAGHDMLLGADGGDELQGGDGDDLLAGGIGVDTLFGDGGRDDLYGGADGDTLYGGAGDDFVSGEEGDDRLQGGEDNDVLEGGDGNDLLFGELGNDVLNGGNGDDQLTAGAGNDLLDGGLGTDVLQGEDGNDVLDGGVGNDDLQGGLGNDTLYGGAGADHLFAQGGDDLMDGEAGDDQLVGDSGSETMQGGEGADSLWGGAGNDLLDGGAGNDFLDGGLGDDTFVVDGVGIDTIQDAGGNNRLRLANAANSEGIWMERANGGTDAIIHLVGGGAVNMFNAFGGAISAVDFGAGGALTWQQFTGQTLTSQVTLNTTVAGSVLNGGAVADTLQATGGGSTFYGGRGNDTLTGNGGNNTYLFDLGDGVDTINDASGYASDKANTLIFGTGIQASDVKLITENNKVVVVVGSGQDKIILGSTNVMAPEYSPTITNFRFSDGSTRTFGQMVAQGMAVTGTDGNDYLEGAGLNDSIEGGAGNDQLYAKDGNDTLHGGIGNDYLDGYYGNDTYLFERGDGRDAISDASGTDTLIFGAGIAPEQVLVSRGSESTDLLLSIRGTSDSVALINWTTTTKIEKVQFADGTVWTNAQLAAGYPYVYGTSGNDNLFGGSGVDILDGGAGDDYLAGRDGDDVYIENGTDGFDRISEWSGTDTVRFGPGITANQLRFTRVDRWGSTNTGIDLLVTLSDGTPLLQIEDWFATSTSTGAPLVPIERFEFADGSVILHTAITQQFSNGAGTAGDDTLVGTDVSNDVLSGLEGNDTLKGLGGNDTLNGDAGDDLLFGNAGADTLRGGAGNDVIEGGDGSDTILFGRGDGVDLVRSFSNEIGVDTVLLDAGIKPTDINLVRNGANLDLAIAGSGDRVSLYGWFNPIGTPVQTSVQFADGSTWTRATLQTMLGMRYGTTANDSMTGTDTTADILYGGDGDDSLTGLGGDDLLAGGPGTDTLTGGLGNDTYFHDGSDQIVEAAGAGTDTVITSGSYTLGANLENLTGFGSTNYHQLTGNTLNNRITGDDWSDVLDGGAGADTLVGGRGSDEYYVDNAGDVIIENATDSGDDKVYSSVSYSLPNGVESLTLTGSLSINATGNDMSNRLIGNDGANQLIGNGGDDYLNGGVGVDTMSGGAGDDRYEVADAGDTVIENVAEGTDTVTLYSVWIGTTYALNPNVENVILSEYTAPGSRSMYALQGVRGANITGSAVANTFTGNGADDSFYGGGGNDLLKGMWGNDTLDGGTGADTMDGGTGNDVFYVDDVGDVVIDNSTDAGIDTVYASVSYILQDGVERLTLTGTSAIDGVGNSADNNLIGNASANRLTGGAGNDVLNGGAGEDTLDGGGGNDTYVVEPGDIIIETAGGGDDTVVSYGSFTLVDNLENLSLAGTDAVNATGNDGVNRLTGNNAANYLFGGGGNDTLDGGAGIDTAEGGIGDDLYYVDSSADIVIERAGEGTDTVMSSVSFTLGEQIEILGLTGTQAINATGNALANTLYGNGGANVLDGGAGADTLIGGFGDDTYVVSDSSDTIVEQTGEGIDTVRSTTTYVLGAELENLSLDGNLAIDGTGNAVSNTLLGNGARNVLTGLGGDDILDGGAGDDIMIGGIGNDSYVVDSASDTIVEKAGEGLDQVTASVSYVLGQELELLVLAGTATNGTGNATANLIKGNASANTLVGDGGNDILQGGAGDDILSDSAGNNLLDGGAGLDTLNAGAGQDFLVGGAGNDIITTGTGRDVIAFNRGDGMDTVNASTTLDNTLSLGKGIRYADLLFKKNLNDLILVTGTNEQITFKDWYASTANHSIANLQIVIEGTADYLPTSTNVINNRKVEVFNFDALVTAFDQARAKKPSTTSWALAGSLSSYHISGSDTAAIGGDLAYQYARNGNLTSLSMTPTQSLLADPLFGQSPQALQSSSALLDTSPRLM